MAVRRVQGGILWDLVGWRCWQRLGKWNVKRCAEREGGLRNARRGLCEMLLKTVAAGLPVFGSALFPGGFFLCFVFVVLIGSGESRVRGVCRL
jgi:hypothetical protein